MCAFRFPSSVVADGNAKLAAVLEKLAQAPPPAQQAQALVSHRAAKLNLPERLTLGLSVDAIEGWMADLPADAVANGAYSAIWGSCESEPTGDAATQCVNSASVESVCPALEKPVAERANPVEPEGGCAGKPDGTFATILHPAHSSIFSGASLARLPSFSASWLKASWTLHRTRCV